MNDLPDLCERAAVILMLSGQFDTAEVAAVVGLPEALVLRLWRQARLVARELRVA